MKDQSYSKTRDNTLRLKNTDDLIKQILELKNINQNVREDDIIELLTIVSCLKYLEDKQQNSISNEVFSSDLVYSSNLNNTKH